MLGDSKALRLREMFRFRSSQRHKQISDNQSGVSNTAKVITPPVPIVRVQCDPSFEAEEEFERELYRVRSFKRTSKGLISLGDSFRSRSTSNCNRPFNSPQTSAVSTSTGCIEKNLESCADNQISSEYGQERQLTSCGEPLSLALEDEHFLSTSPPSSILLTPLGSPSNIAAPVKVQILGGPTVGKTMLCRQFLTTEFMGGKTESFSEDSIERFVVIEVDGWNRSLMLIDNIREEPADDTHSLENSIAFFTPHQNLLKDEPTFVSKVNAEYAGTSDRAKLPRERRKSSFCNFKPGTLVERRTLPDLEMRILDVDIYVVVYAVDEEVSFKLAKSIFKQLQEIRRSDSKLRLFYLVGNKTDLVRSRQVTTQRGRRLATANGAMFFEVSAAINHLVDELLVDMVVLWRKESTQFEFSRLGLPVHNGLHPEDPTRIGGPANSRERQSWTSTLNKPRNMLQHVFKQQFNTKSCMDLQKQ